MVPTLTTIHEFPVNRLYECKPVKRAELCFLWTFLTLTNFQTVRSKLNLLFVDLEESESWDQMKCCSSKKGKPCSDKFSLNPYILNYSGSGIKMAVFRTTSSSESYAFKVKICKSSNLQNSARDFTNSN